MKKYKDVRITDIFKFERGQRLIEKEQVTGETPYISSTKKNNGISGFVTPPDFMTIHKNKLTLSNSGSIGYCFYHPYKFVASDHVTVIWLKDDSIKLDYEIALYLKPVIESMRSKFGFGREISNKRLRKEKIRLPVDNSGNIDWEYMKNKISELHSSVEFKPLEKKKIIDKNIQINIEDWRNTSILDLFKVSAGTYYPVNSFKEGDTPLISASDRNNGIMSYTNLKPQYEENAITIGKIGMTCYYQTDSFCATGDVTVLEPKFEEFNKYIALFIISVLSLEKHKWSYGRQIRLNDVKKLKVMLPYCDHDKEQLDYSKMENIIKNSLYSKYI